jgi:hypothetical protein
MPNNTLWNRNSVDPESSGMFGFRTYRVVEEATMIDTTSHGIVGMGISSLFIVIDIVISRLTSLSRLPV